MKWLRARVIAWLYPEAKDVQGLLTANYVAIRRLEKAIERFESNEASRVFGVTRVWVENPRKD